MLAQQKWTLGIEAAEVKEPEWPVIDEVALTVRRQPTAVQIPVRDVIRRVLQNEVLVEGGDEVGPSLIGEHHA